MLRLVGNARRMAVAGTAGGGRWLSAAATAAARPNWRLEGKIALITGGASGLGKATAHEFINEGATVLLADTNSELGIQTAQELGPRAEFVPCDVTVEANVADAVDNAVARYGRLDIMFNNAGVVGTLAGTAEIAHLDLAQFENVMSVNVRGTLAGIKHAARVMGPTGSGSILCMASISGLMGGLGTYPYSVSKFAIAGIVKAATAELTRQGIRINCISPYAIPTPMVVEQFSQMFQGVGEAQVTAIIKGLSELSGATCEAMDVAKAAAYLASDDAKFVSGHNLVVDGGFTSYKHLNLPFPKAME